MHSVRKLFALLSILALVSLPLDASTTKTLYGTSNQAITCTFTSLTNGSYRQSTVIDNSSNLFLDALVMVKAKSASSSTSATGYVAIYGYGTADGGTTYDGGASGSDASYTVDVTPPNLVLIGILNLNANSTTVQRTFSVATAFGGQLPQKWGIIVLNATGATLDASIGSAWFQGVQAQAL